MKILERIISGLEEREIVSVHLGFFTTAVVSRAADGVPRCGLATTLRGGACTGPLEGAGAF